MELRFFELYRSAEYIQLLAEGASVSFFITVSAGIFGFVLAFGLAGLRYFEVPIANILVAAYVDFIRNTPLIVQLFFIAFGMPLLFGYVWPFWCHALLALSINFFGLFCRNPAKRLCLDPQGPNRSCSRPKSDAINHFQSADRAAGADQNVSFAIKPVHFLISDHRHHLGDRCRRSDPCRSIHRQPHLPFV